MGVVMGFIILSFAIWGVGDIFRGFGAGKLAQVGDTEIQVETFRNQYQTMLQQVQRQYRRAITNDQARAMGLDQQVLGRLIAEAALDVRVKALGLAMSDAEIAKAILNDQTFAGPTGKFDATKFQELLRDNGYTEQSFVREQRRVYLRQEIIDALTAKMSPSVAMLDAIHKYRDEARSVDFVVLPPTAAGEITNPSDEDLQKFFAARAQGFRAPEFRKIVVLGLSPATVADASKVSDADAMKLYDTVKAQRFGTPETRELQQVVFPDEAAAQAASEAIKGGKSLQDVSAEANLNVVDLGTLSRSQLFDRAIGDAAFALPEAGVSAPVKGQFGYVLLRAVKINPETVKPFDEVAESLKKEIATDRARKTVQELRDKIEDERASGKPLEDAAKVAGLQVRTVESVDQTGRDKSGAEVADLPEKDALLKAAFTSDIGVDNETLNARDGGFVWFEVAGIERARERKLDEVKDQVLAAWRDDEIARRLSEKATTLAKRLATESMEDVAKSEGDLEVKHIGDVKRSGAEGLSPAAVARIFSVPVGEAGSAEGGAQSRILFKVLDSSTPPLDLDNDVTKGMDTQLRTALSEEVLTQYISKLQADIGVTVNQSAFVQAVGGSVDSNPY
jgi:peptidyl-prolyl cis-trans isomerase D